MPSIKFTRTVVALLLMILWPAQRYSFVTVPVISRLKQIHHARMYHPLAQRYTLELPR
jgi:hypothetical protein